MDPEPKATINKLLEPFKTTTLCRYGGNMTLKILKLPSDVAKNWHTH